MTERAAESERIVRQFRQILVWPLQLMPIHEGEQVQNHWEALLEGGPDNPWREVQDEFDDPAKFQERHYNEFVAFLPHAQRMLYGEGKGCGTVAGESPIRVFRRNDITRVRLEFPGDAPRTLELNVAHVDLYFFYDLDIVILTVEVSASNLPFADAHEVLFRFGRSYPTYWHADGRGGHCFRKVEWLGRDGQVLAVSDYERREKYLSFVCRYRSPCISTHLEFLLQPLVLHHSDRPGAIRYRLVEYHRMPICGFLTLDEPRQLTRADHMRLALVTPPGPSDTLPLPERMARDFEDKYCYDRFWSQDGPSPAGIRTLCSGEAFIMVGTANNRAYPGGGPDFLELFRHQFFLLFLIAHLHKASLFMLSDRLLHALNLLQVGNAESVRRFKRDIRQYKEIFLRFTHRYWFREMSDQLQAKALYRMCQEHLGIEKLYEEVSREIEDMNVYLDSDSIRRQANMVIRLTVVTIFGLIGTVVTGFFGMNLFNFIEGPLSWRVLYGLGAIALVTGLTFYTVIKSKRLADFLDALSDERLPARTKALSLAAVWKRGQDPDSARGPGKLWQ